MKKQYLDILYRQRQIAEEIVTDWKNRVNYGGKPCVENNQQAQRDAEIHLKAINFLIDKYIETHN